MSIVHTEARRGRPTYVRSTIDLAGVSLYGEVVSPAIGSWIEEANDHPGLWIGRCYRGEFASVARTTGERQIRLIVGAAEVAGDDVFDLERAVTESLGREAVFTAVSGPFGNEPPESMGHRERVGRLGTLAFPLQVR